MQYMWLALCHAADVVWTVSYIKCLLNCVTQHMMNVHVALIESLNMTLIITDITHHISVSEGEGNVS